VNDRGGYDDRKHAKLVIEHKIEKARQELVRLATMPNSAYSIRQIRREIRDLQAALAVLSDEPKRG